jgi:hypothetical protein
VHPSLLELYEDGKLEKWLRKENDFKSEDGLEPLEKMLVEILDSF